VAHRGVEEGHGEEGELEERGEEGRIHARIIGGAPAWSVRLALDYPRA
jgi:hypothetical protein